MRQGPWCYAEGTAAELFREVREPCAACDDFDVAERTLTLRDANGTVLASDGITIATRTPVFPRAFV